MIPLRPPVQPSRAWRSRGFTLVEILVVLVVIGILTTLVMLRPGSARESRELESTADALRARIALASDESQLTGASIGVMFQPDSYVFLRPVEERWQEVAGDRALDRTLLPDWIELELVVEGEPVDLYEEATRVEPVPSVLILPSGEITPFEADFTTVTPGGPVWRLSADWSGALELERVDGDVSDR